MMRQKMINDIMELVEKHGKDYITEVLKEYGKDKVLQVWSAEDIISRAKDIGAKISKSTALFTNSCDDARKVLKFFENNV